MLPFQVRNVDIRNVFAEGTRTRGSIPNYARSQDLQMPVLKRSLTVINQRACHFGHPEQLRMLLQPRYLVFWLFLVFTSLNIRPSGALWSSTSDSEESDPYWAVDPDGNLEYGVDVSFPMHHSKVLAAPKNPLGDKQKAYEEFIQGCVEKFGSRGNRCMATEQDRVEMSLRQPQSMQVSVNVVVWMLSLVRAHPLLDP